MTTGRGGIHRHISKWNIVSHPNLVFRWIFNKKLYTGPKDVYDKVEKLLWFFDISHGRLPDNKTLQDPRRVTEIIAQANLTRTETYDFLPRIIGRPFYNKTEVLLTGRCRGCAFDLTQA